MWCGLHNSNLTCNNKITSDYSLKNLKMNCIKYLKQNNFTIFKIITLLKKFHLKE